MRDINNMSKYSYIFDNIFYGILSVYLYKRLIFTNINYIDDNTSKWILYCFTSLFIIVGIVLTLNHRRNSLNVFVNIAFPIAIYTIITYFTYLCSLIIISLIIATLLSIVYILLTKKYIKSFPGIKSHSIKFKRFCILGTRTIISFCISLCIFYLLITSITGIQLFSPENIHEKNSVQSYVEYYEIHTNTFNNLEENKWRKLSIDAKLNVLQVVCNTEKIKLGIKEPILIKSKVLKSNLLGEYIYKDNTVLINTKHLEKDSSYSILKTVTHECFHCYERSLVDLYDNLDKSQKKLMFFNHIGLYRDEFNNYEDGNSEEYYSQVVEEDARQYSESAVNDYKNKIRCQLKY